MKEMLLNNYNDHVYLKNFNRQNRVKLFQHLRDIDEDNDDSGPEPMQRFFAVCRSKNSKPLWQGFSETQSPAEKAALQEHLPYSFRQAVVTR